MTVEPRLETATGWQLRDAIINRKISAVETARYFLDRIAAVDSEIHSFITVAAEPALRQAADIDKRIGRGEKVGRLAGIPVSIKDQFWTKGIRTTGGSSVFRDHVPVEDSIHVARIKAANGIVIGKTNTPEFGMYWRTVGSVAPECVNPWDRSRTAGGSSGGAAASVAAGLGPLALGSDAGGSIRLPSAMCGVFGLLPSKGRVPRHGGFGSAMFFSGIGPIARDVRDAAHLLQVLAEPASFDPFCRLDAAPDFLGGLEKGIEGVRMAWWDYPEIADRVSQEVLAAAGMAASEFAGLGARMAAGPVVLDTEGVDDAWKVLDFVDRYADLGEGLCADPGSSALLTPYARTRFADAAKISGTTYARAVRRRAGFIREMERVFADCDLLLSPTLGVPAPIIDRNDITQRIPAIVAYTLPVNFAGYTAATVPCGFVRGLPVGLQIIGRPNEEALVLRACRAFERASPWKQNRPVLQLPGDQNGELRKPIQP
jgi:Asp-tRNA(Asn)/Glu-tRNA(Gln) amidotransferase A subunit family amidase